jgi:hypothetical protein
MEKSEILKKIDDFIIVEEQAIPVISNHMKTIFKWSKINNEDKKTIHSVFDKLIDESKTHKLMLETVKKIIEEE